LLPWRNPVKLARALGIALLLASGPSLLSAVAAEKSVSQFAPGDQSLTTLNAGLPDSEYGYHPDNDSSFGEGWYFLAIDEAGNQIWILLSINNYRPFATSDGTVDLFYYGIDGTTSTGHVETKSDQVKADLNKVDVNIAGSTIKGTFPDYALDLKAEDLKMKLHFRGETPDFMLGQDMIHFGSEMDRIWTVGVMAPRAKVTGTVTIDDKEIPFDGKGYFDHGRSNIKIPDFSRWWYVLRILEDDFSLGAMQIVLTEDYDAGEISVIHLTLGDTVIANSGAVTIDHAGELTHEGSEIIYPETFTINYSNGNTKLTGTVKFDRMVEGINVLDRLSAIVRKFVRVLYTDPWQFRLSGSADLSLEHNGEIRKLNGVAIGEVHHYK
jgi:hypothetical protein